MAGEHITAVEVRDRLTTAISAFGPGSQAAWAKAHGISPQFVNDVVRGRRGPGPKILAALGLKPAVAVAEVI